MPITQETQASGVANNVLALVAGNAVSANGAAVRLIAKAI